MDVEHQQVAQLGIAALLTQSATRSSASVLLRVKRCANEYSESEFSSTCRLNHAFVLLASGIERSLYRLIYVHGHVAWYHRPRFVT